MGSDFGVKDAAGKVIQTAGEVQEEIPEKVSAQARIDKNLTRVVIIGGGACGMAAATKIRRQRDFKITVLSSDSHTAYSHCGIPFVLGREIESFEKLIVKPPGFFREKNIDVKLNEKVRSIDLTRRVALTGEGAYPFDKLVIATGSLPFISRKSQANILPYGIFTLRSLADGMLFGKALETARTVCIVGGGTIGIECASALKKRGIKTILITRSKDLLSSQFDSEMSAIVRAHLEALGVEVITGEPIFLPENFWKEKTVFVKDRQFPADLVLLATGVKPEVYLAREAGIDIGKAGGIVVNEMLQVKAGGEFLPHVYAGGECAEVTDLVTGESRLSQLGTTARRMADVIGNNITGKYSTLGPLADPWVAVAGDLQFGGVGLTPDQAEKQGIKVVTGFSRGRTRASYYPGRKDLYIKLVFKNDCLAGAQLAGGEGIKERIDTLSLAIRKKTTIKDLLSLETCYAPPVSMLVDPLLPAVKDAIRNMRKEKTNELDPDKSLDERYG
ncbi:NAD(P)/FAD-dependent oxidoreductase [Methanosarcina sp. 2.H.A.1B.4]|uniref:NAD(P)/FAD-dependent oxidoreductase n=1 Tax=Methanosarcina sp. 2.H.A.1B.4 TaxID=1483600 RepID=UPI0006217534|nr:FAD-dependent oxidoreductase [Methanosarcina sp. 2.H.A.1B.4]KKG10126.1 NADH dehydrogenase [Methanosarcina sp. 2.H.A.1B.4]